MGVHAHFFHLQRSVRCGLNRLHLWSVCWHQDSHDICTVYYVSNWRGEGEMPLVYFGLCFKYLFLVCASIRSHFWRPPIAALHYYVTDDPPTFFSCLKSFSLGLGGARQLPGIVRNLTVQGFQAHVCVLQPHTRMWRACFYAVNGTTLWLEDNSSSLCLHF